MIGFLCSAGGSPVFSALDILFVLNIIRESEIKILSDRNSGAIEKAKSYGINNKIIDWSSSFSNSAYEYFCDCDFVLLLFSRLVKKELFENVPTLNIHPSLLPCFKGFGALDNVLKFQVKHFGSTLHIVNEQIDDGPIIGQVVQPTPNNANLQLLQKYSYLQKTYLTLLAINLLIDKTITIFPKNQSVLWNKETQFSNFANPRISNKKIENEYLNLYKFELGTELCA
jgi:phosphoribosylglycinamide formyltransferase-1